MDNVLSPDTRMGPVTLHVADPVVMTRYYRDTVGLDVLGEGPGTVTLGRPGRPVIVLNHTPRLRHAGPGQAGLFHTAILFDTRAALAAAVLSVARAHPHTFVGASDHLVSEAFYFDDPEGNGVELYWDRDRSDWRWTGGRVHMATLPLDPNRFLSEHLTEAGTDAPLHEAASVGHVHLSVGDVGTARSFYVDALGFEPTASFGDQALFVSAGRYHHHMAMNVWNSRGAGRRQPTLGLGRVDIEVAAPDEVDRTAERLRVRGVDVRDDGRTLEVFDPWSNLIRVTAPGRG